jgi:hypothetical protein
VLDWIGLVQDREKRRRFQKVVIILRFPEKSGKFSSGCTTGGLSNSAQLHRVSSLYIIMRHEFVIVLAISARSNDL